MSAYFSVAVVLGAIGPLLHYAPSIVSILRWHRYWWVILAFNTVTRWAISFGVSSGFILLKVKLLSCIVSIFQEPSCVKYPLMASGLVVGALVCWALLAVYAVARGYERSPSNRVYQRMAVGVLVSYCVLAALRRWLFLAENLGGVHGQGLPGSPIVWPTFLVVHDVVQALPGVLFCVWGLVGGRFRAWLGLPRAASSASGSGTQQE